MLQILLKEIMYRHLLDQDVLTDTSFLRTDDLQSAIDAFFDGEASCPLHTCLPVSMQHRPIHQRLLG
jgi:hypothetical protein